MADRSIGVVDVLVGQRLKMARMIKGVTQEKLAEAIGVTFQQVQKYENGKNRIGTGRLHAIAEVLDVPVAFFFEGAKSARASTTADLEFIYQALSTKEGLRIAVSLARISDMQLRRRIADLLEAIIANETEGSRIAPHARARR